MRFCLGKLAQTLAKEVEMSNDIQDSRLAMALARYQAISAYLADPPRWGQRRAYLEKLAQKTWTGPDGEPIRAAIITPGSRLEMTAIP